MLLAVELPNSVGPYVALMAIGFAVGAYGHAARSRWLVAFGILLIFCATLLFPIALNLFQEHPKQPGPVTPRPY